MKLKFEQRLFTDHWVKVLDAWVRCVLGNIISKITSTLCAETAGMVRGSWCKESGRCGAPAVMAPCGVTPFLRALLPDKQQKKSERWGHLYYLVTHIISIIGVLNNAIIEILGKRNGKWYLLVNHCFWWNGLLESFCKANHFHRMNDVISENLMLD